MCWTLAINHATVTTPILYLVAVFRLFHRASSTEEDLTASFDRWNSLSSVCCSPRYASSVLDKSTGEAGNAMLLNAKDFELHEKVLKWML